MKKFWLFSCLVLLAGSLAAAGCSRSSGTYVVLDLRGSLSNIRSIAVDLDMGGQKANAVFTAPVASTITLPTDAILQIQHGSGMLYVTATAKAVDQQVLGTGTGSGPVVAGETKHITVQFGGSEGDAGVFDGSDGPGGSSGDAPVDHFVDLAAAAVWVVLAAAVVWVGLAAASEPLAAVGQGARLKMRLPTVPMAAPAAARAAEPEWRPS